MLNEYKSMDANFICAQNNPVMSKRENNDTHNIYMKHIISITFRPIGTAQKWDTGQQFVKNPLQFAFKLRHMSWVECARICSTCKVEISALVTIANTVIVQNSPTLYCIVCAHNYFNSLLTFRTFIFHDWPCSNVTNDFSSFLSYFPAFFLVRRHFPNKENNYLPLSN